MTTDQDDIARRIVDREVRLCLSALVSTLAAGSGHAIGDRDAMRRGNLADLQTLAEQAAELSYPVPDYEEAAREAGWITADLTPRMFVKPSTAADNEAGEAETFEYEDWQDGWRELCEAEGIDPYDRDVFEHWAISDWLADKLEAKGEKVDRDFAGLIVWARTTTGQAIYCDGVIQDIAADLAKAAT
jgi:hypothetical protein